MASRLKAVLPLTVSIGLLAFLASEVALNVTFHWVTVDDGVFGAYGLPHGTHLVLPALFVAWASTSCSVPIAPPSARRSRRP